MEKLEKKLDFARPPVDEVVLSVLIQSLDNLLAPHLGAIWTEFKKDRFVRIFEQPPVIPTVEKLTNSMVDAELRIGNIPELARIWFIHENEDQILQVQRDRFTFNWRKTDSDQKYPGFSTIYERFQDFYSRFCLTIEKLDVGSVQPLQYELTYIDQLMYGESWNSIYDVGKIFNMFNDSFESEHFWEGAESLNFRTTFPVRDLHSRLHVAISNRLKMPEKIHTLQTDFTLRGSPENADYEIATWFNLARDRINDKFVSMFSENIQTQVWGRNNGQT